MYTYRTFGTAQVNSYYGRRFSFYNQTNKAVSNLITRTGCSPLFVILEVMKDAGAGYSRRNIIADMVDRHNNDLKSCN